jgi:hypothetical protein
MKCLIVCFGRVRLATATAKFNDYMVEEFLIATRESGLRSEILTKVSGHHDIAATLIHLNDEKRPSIRRDS